MNEIVATSGIQGWYRLEAFTPDENGEEIPDTRRLLADWFPNLITDFGLNAIGTTTSSHNFARVGTGNTAPTVLDTALVAQVASTSTNQSTVNTAQTIAPFYIEQVVTKRFALGAAAGNLAEVGMGSAASGANLWSRALIVDGSNNPTTITILPSEILDVTYKIRIIPPTGDVLGNITLASIVYSYTLRASQVTSANITGWEGFTSSGTDVAALTLTGFSAAFSGAIGPITSNPSGTAFVITSANSDAYSNNSLQRDGNFNWGLNEGNVPGGIRSVAVAFGCCRYQIEFSPVIPKDVNKTLTLKVRHQWARAVIP
jgi:hypothetical protein